MGKLRRGGVLLSLLLALDIRIRARNNDLAWKRMAPIHFERVVWVGLVIIM